MDQRNPADVPRPPTRRRLLKAAAGAVAAAAGLGVYSHWIEPTWVEVTGPDLPVPNLPPEWEGVRVAQVSDLHCSPWVPTDYLAGALHRVQELRPDLIVVTGDFVTLRQEGGYTDVIAELVGGLRAPLGVFTCLGNHDYGPCGIHAEGSCTSITESLDRFGVPILRNSAVRLTRGGADLWLVGIEDILYGRPDPAAAMFSVPRGAANLTLCHNPDAADQLAEAGCGAILSGHTHGGQVDLPLVGPLFVPVYHRDRYRGMHWLGNSWLYVNRGLGWILMRCRFLCRPEIALLTLRRAAPAADPASRT